MEILFVQPSHPGLEASCREAMARVIQLYGKQA
jgi:hypothetical protein